MSAKLKYDFEKGKTQSQRKIKSLSFDQRQENNEMNQSMMDELKDGMEGRKMEWKNGRWNGRMERRWNGRWNGRRKDMY